MLVLIFFCLLSTTRKFSFARRFSIFLLLVATSTGEENATSSACGEIGDCIVSQDCDRKCGCDSSAAVLFYNETLEECVVNVKMLLQSLQEKYNIQEKISMEVNEVFDGIMISVILFMTCASLCTCMACCYCIRMNYMDYKMKNDIEALAAKLKRDCRYKKSLKIPTPHQKAESCNIIVEDAGVFVV